MRFATWTSVLFAGAALGLALPASQAEELNVPAEAPAAASQPVDHPTRGMSMEKVEAAFGAPSNREPAVGQPPITRWEYPGFVVYFEKHTVLHTVIKG
jgi:hypothetical protein